MAEAVQPEPLCVRFVNTVDWRDDPARRVDTLSSYADLLHWAHQAQIVSPVLTRKLEHAAAQHPGAAHSAFSHAIALREAIYAVLLAALAGHPPRPHSLATLNQALSDCGRHQCLAPSNGRLSWAWDD